MHVPMTPSTQSKINISVTCKSLLVSLCIIFSWTIQDHPECYFAVLLPQHHFTISFLRGAHPLFVPPFWYASTPLFLFLSFFFFKQSTPIWRFIRDSILSLADSKSPIYNDKNAAENSSRIKFWVGKTIWVILHCVRFCLLFAFLHQITALHSVLSQLSPVSATFCSCRSSCWFYLPLLTRGCHLVQSRKSIQRAYRKRKNKELIVLYMKKFLKFLYLP